MENFTPLSATIGGALIGTSAVMLMALHGRIAGISGIVSGAMTGNIASRTWRVAFLLGLIIAPLLLGFSGGHLPLVTINANYPTIILGGLLVGYGTILGTGCTSGHGVCGLARLSPRSIVAVGLFMGVGIASATLIRMIRIG